MLAKLGELVRSAIGGSIMDPVRAVCGCAGKTNSKVIRCGHCS